MEDKDIVAMYWRREEDAINETSLKYGKYCYSIAYQIYYFRFMYAIVCGSGEYV